MKRPFLDTSILVGGCIDFGDSSKAPMAIIDRIADKQIHNAATAWHCCLEFYSVTTRLPEEYRLSPKTAKEFVIEEIMARLDIRTLDAARQEDFFIDAGKQIIRGGRIYDHHIGTIALKGNATVIVTENKKHFSLFERQGLPVLNSNEFIQALDSLPNQTA
jgi:predicted nucleic acid-binding protein